MQFQQGYRPPQANPPGRRLSQRGKHALLTAALVILVIGIVAVSAVFAARARETRQAQQALQSALSPYQDRFLPNIYMDGIALGGMTAQEGLSAVIGRIQSRESGWKLDLNYQGHCYFTVDYAFLGMTTDLVQVHAELERLYRLGKVGTLEERKQQMDDLAAQPYHGYTMQTDGSDQHLDSILAQIDAEVSSEPTNAAVAYFSPDLSDPFIIQPAINGQALDVAALKEQILERAASGQSGELQITPEVIPATVTEADVRRQVTLLCKATTPISSSSTAYRTSNIRTAFSRLNGQTVAPGKEFSFNKTTLERTEKNGYLPAIEYGEGGLEEIGIGGGVCQASTTLYLAALKSGLQIVERSPHASEVSYTTFGQDATVTYGRLDLRFRNSLSSTIYITARVEETGKNRYQCVVCIYGPSQGDLTYKLRTETVETLSAPTTPEYTKDKKHTYVTYKDEEPVLIRSARDGFINETYLQVYQGGRLISETLVSRDTCKPRAEMYAVGTLNR